MSFGLWGDYADTVSDEFVKEQCPETHKALMDVVEHADLDMDTVAQGLDKNSGYDALDGADEESEAEIRVALNDLIKAFGGKTRLLLEIRFVESEGKHDEINGFFWGVEKVYEYTPAGRKLKDKIVRKGWVVSG